MFTYTHMCTVKGFIPKIYFFPCCELVGAPTLNFNAGVLHYLGCYNYLDVRKFLVILIFHNLVK